MMPAKSFDSSFHARYFPLIRAFGPPSPPRGEGDLWHTFVFTRSLLNGGIWELSPSVAEQAEAFSRCASSWTVESVDTLSKNK